MSIFTDAFRQRPSLHKLDRFGDAGSIGHDCPTFTFFLLPFTFCGGASPV
ncbi:MAG: hypothetical protein RIC55_35705 [Pirellulaceae bacterium]